jgi:hypothetical protein
VARVFLSYRHDEDLDAKIAEAIYTSLNNLNHEVFLDLKRIRPGDVWAETIEKNLKIAEYFVPFMSSAYLYRTKTLREEATGAIDLERRGLKILPVNLAFNGDYPDELRRFADIQQISWRRESDLKSVVEQLSKELPTPFVLVRGLQARLAGDLTRCFQKYSKELLRLEIDSVREGWNPHQHIEIVKRDDAARHRGLRREFGILRGIFSQAVRLYDAWLPKHRDAIVNTLWRQALSIATTRQHDRAGGHEELRWKLPTFSRHVRSRCADSVRGTLEPLIVSFLCEAHALEVGALEVHAGTLQTEVTRLIQTAAEERRRTLADEQPVVNRVPLRAAVTTPITPEPSSAITSRLRTSIKICSTCPSRRLHRSISAGSGAGCWKAVGTIATPTLRAHFQPRRSGISPASSPARLVALSDGDCSTPIQQPTANPLVGFVWVLLQCQVRQAIRRDSLGSAPCESRLTHAKAAS